MKSLKKITLFILLSISAVFADITTAQNIDDNRLMMSLKLFPRLVAVDLDISKKLNQDQEILLLVFYQTDKWRADKVTKVLNEQIKNIAGMPIKAEAVEKLPEKPPSGIILIEKMNRLNLSKVINYGIQHHILVFSPYEEDVKMGVTSGMYIQIQTMPYFNRMTLKKSGIRIHDIILRSSKFYE